MIDYLDIVAMLVIFAFLEWRSRRDRSRVKDAVVSVVSRTTLFYLARLVRAESAEPMTWHESVIRASKRFTEVSGWLPASDEPPLKAFLDETPP